MSVQDALFEAHVMNGGAEKKNDPALITRRPRLPPSELDICKAVGAKWVSRDTHDGDTVELYTEKPERGDFGEYYSADDEWIANIDSRLFPSVKPGDCICVEEACLLGAKALCAQQEAEKNEPLTLHELWQMDREPVWVHPLVHGWGESRWGLVSVFRRSEMLEEPWVYIYDVHGGIRHYPSQEYGICWVAYRWPTAKEER